MLRYAQKGLICQTTCPVLYKLKNKRKNEQHKTVRVGIFLFLQKSVYFGFGCSKTLRFHSQALVFPAEKEVRRSKNLCSYSSTALTSHILKSAQFADINGVLLMCCKRRKRRGTYSSPGPSLSHFILFFHMFPL